MALFIITIIAVSLILTYAFITSFIKDIKERHKAGEKGRYEQ